MYLIISSIQNWPPLQYVAVVYISVRIKAVLFQFAMTLNDNCDLQFLVLVVVHNTKAYRVVSVAWRAILRTVKNSVLITISVRWIHRCTSIVVYCTNNETLIIQIWTIQVTRCVTVPCWLICQYFYVLVNCPILLFIHCHMATCYFWHHFVPPKRQFIVGIF
jgi:hypothetical protein